MRAWAIACCIVAGVGCNPLLGTNDVELEYRVDDPELVGRLIELRLASVGLTADVDARDGSTLVVRIDAERAAYAEKLLSWSGQLTLHAHGGEVLALTPDWRSLRPEGKTVVVPFERSDHAALRGLAPGPVQIELMGKVVWSGSRDEVLDGISIPWGTDIRAYMAARRGARMLSSPRLPALALVSRGDADPDWVLAIASIGVPLVTALLWIGLVRRLDRAHPEPWRLVLATFGLGAVAQLVAGRIEVGLWHASPYLDPRVMALDHSTLGLVLSFLVHTVVVGGSEEGAKLLAVVGLARRSRAFDEPVDGIVYAAVAAIGFAAMENVTYFTSLRLTDGVSAARTLDAISGHMMTSAIWGYALGQQLLRKSWRRLAGYFVLAAALHGAWDTACEFTANHVLYTLTAVHTVLFAVLLRRALRWGIAQHHAAGGARGVFPVGRRMLFIMAVLSMYGAAHLLISLAHGADLDGQRVTLELAVWGAGYAVLFAAAALLAAKALPLDVIVDGSGVTFAGSLHPWSTIRSAERVSPWAVVLHGTARDVLLSPGATATMDRLEAALARRLNAVPERADPG